MLEFKNVTVSLPGGEASTSFSMMLSGGETACLCGPAGSGKSRLLRAVMGLTPVASGYITVDGELVGPDSAGYLRQKISFVPSQMPDVQMKVSDLCRSVYDLRINHDAGLTKEKLMKEWRLLGIDETVYGLPVSEVEQQIQQLVLLSLLSLLKRPIVLVDNLLQTEQTYRLLQRLVADGAEVLYTCKDNRTPCDKLIKF